MRQLGERSEWSGLMSFDVSIVLDDEEPAKVLGA
jgi:hypothetical protein